MKRVTFYYVRHGKTEFNRDQIIQGGRADSPLASEGIPVVENTARALASVDFARCWRSPLGRVAQTTDILLAGRDVPVTVLDNLREFDFGEIDGKPYQSNRGTFIRCFLRQDFSSVGGETGEQVRERVRRAFHKMYKAAKDGDKVLVVAHGAYLRYVVQEFSQMSKPSRAVVSRTMKAPNASISILVDTDGSCVLTDMPMTAKEYLRRYPVL